MCVCVRGKANSPPRSTGYGGVDIWQAPINLLLAPRQLLFTELSGWLDNSLSRTMWQLYRREHFTSWICRWQIQLNPQPLLIAALAWQSHCGSRWCPLGALQRKGRQEPQSVNITSTTPPVFPPSWIMQWAVYTHEAYVNQRWIILIYSSMDFSYSLSY